jgi:hypothetical protein
VKYSNPSKLKKMNRKEKIIVQGTEITIISSKGDDYISLTDMANAKEGGARAADIIKNWLRTRTTLEFLGTWEQLYNSGFIVVEFDHFKMQAGLPSFVLSTGEWIEKTNAIGIYVKYGKYKCFTNPVKTFARRAFGTTKQCRHCSNEIANGQSKFN